MSQITTPKPRPSTFDDLHESERKGHVLLSMDADKIQENWGLGGAQKTLTMLAFLEKQGAEIVTTEYPRHTEAHLPLSEAELQEKLAHKQRMWDRGERVYQHILSSPLNAVTMEDRWSNTRLIPGDIYSTPMYAWEYAEMAGIDTPDKIVYPVDQAYEFVDEGHEIEAPIRAAIGGSGTSSDVAIITTIKEK